MLALTLCDQNGQENIRPVLHNVIKINNAGFTGQIPVILASLSHS